jgi:SAM-dependent methyltransferase
VNSIVRKIDLPISYARALLLFAFSPLLAQSGIGEQYNVIYSDGAEQAIFDHAPNAFLVEFIKTLKPGRALDVGMGQGRNTIYLAQRGYQVTGFDLAAAGVNLAREQAAKSGVKVTAVLADAQTYDFGEAQWDLIVFCYVPFDGLTERVERGLKPGGIVLVENFHRDTAKVRLLPEGFGDNELLQAFHGFRILHYEDVLTRQDWGAQLADANRIVRLAAQKPKPAAPGCTWESKPYAEGETACWGVIRIACQPQGWTRSGSCPH